MFAFKLSGTGWVKSEMVETLKLSVPEEVIVEAPME